MADVLTFYGILWGYYDWLKKKRKKRLTKHLPVSIKTFSLWQNEGLDFEAWHAYNGNVWSKSKCLIFS